MKVWIPRNLRDDGMIMVHECYGHHQCEHTYVRVDDHLAALAEKERFLEHQRTATYQAVMREQATKKLLSEKEREIERLREWQRIVSGVGTDQEAVVRMAADEYTKTAIECWKDRVDQLQADLDQVIGEAIGFAGIVKSTRVWAADVQQAIQFLTSPLVQSWQVRQQ